MATPLLTAPVLPLIHPDDVLHYIEHSKNDISPGYDKFRMEHLKALTASSKLTHSADEILFLEKLTDPLNLLNRVNYLRIYSLSSILPILLLSIKVLTASVQLFFQQLLRPCLLLFISQARSHAFLPSRGTETIIHTIHTLMAAYPKFDIFFANLIIHLIALVAVQSRIALKLVR